MLDADITTPSGIRIQIVYSQGFHTITLSLGQSRLSSKSSNWYTIKDFIKACTEMAVFITCNNVPRDFTDTLAMLEGMR
jgi:hypothetical protein